MKRTARIATLSLGFLLLFAPAAVGQELAADVQTWNGQSWRLTQASLEIAYTIVPEPAEGRLPGPSETASPSETLGAKNVALFGSAKALGHAFESRPEPLSGRRRSDVITLYRDGVETRVPLSSIETITFARQPVGRNPLPPYLAPLHFRHSAVVILTDGSRVETDYVNLGTAVLRGTTAHGRAEIPWDQIAVVRFTR
jgi:hypothetical protein